MTTKEPQRTGVPWCSHWFYDFFMARREGLWRRSYAPLGVPEELREELLHYRTLLLAPAQWVS